MTHDNSKDELIHRDIWLEDLPSRSTPGKDLPLEVEQPKVELEQQTVEVELEPPEFEVEPKLGIKDL